MSDYFANAAPFLSDNNVNTIVGKMEEGFDFLVEYGMGASTLFFIERFRAKRATLVSVENTFSWYREVIERTSQRFPLNRTTNRTSTMNIFETYGLISRLNQGRADLPAGLSRRGKWKESLLLGPFYRFSPLSASRHAGRVPLWGLFRPVSILVTFVLYLTGVVRRPTFGEFEGQVDDLKIVYRNVPPTLKDQFGESPTMPDYIEAGLSDVREALAKKDRVVKALFVVDGGPRGEIVKAILDLEAANDHLHVAVFLCDAHQAFYRDVLAKRSTGTFLAGSNRTLTGRTVQEKPEKDDEPTMLYKYGKTSVTQEELSAKEVWFYESERKAVTA